MNYALIFAGGTGRRMNTTDKPKQFLELHGKPIIIYTIEHFEKHSEIDSICVVCLKSYIEELKFLLDKWAIKKVNLIVPGNDEGGDRSIYCGLDALSAICKEDDTVLIHDGVRPLINSKLIDDVIECVHKNGTAITIDSVTESIANISDRGVAIPPRHEMFAVKAPQAFTFSLIWDLYKKALRDGYRTIDSAHLCSIYGVPMHFVQSSNYNVKITKQEDYYVFRALFEAIENKQLV
jgi:2-C-methyl-D-erythritol 4-phosphate cytidylyltransferase